ncbi:MAG TPA: DUF4136 domain-containing protein [Caldithrix abyssi]|uniref:DUF4136 domain-containing protein n=1 Tax=Caldithrix abyssi TaxID=187145 RepID=A0A7V4WU99_CALAY|nr:DUF4136 domain-containing protein [Caldithrix abyssi]
MRLFKSSLIFSIFLLVFFGCSSISVVTDYDRDVDFSEYKTFNIYSGKTSEDDAIAQNPLLKKRVESAIKDLLEEKGFVYKEGADADFTVFVHGVVKQKTQVTNLGPHGPVGPYRYGYGWYDSGWWGYGHNQVDISQYDEGTAIIDIISLKKKELIWRGMGTSVVRELTGSKEDLEEIREYAAKILKDFPPVK